MRLRDRISVPGSLVPDLKVSGSHIVQRLGGGGGAVTERRSRYPRVLLALNEFPDRVDVEAGSAKISSAGLHGEASVSSARGCGEDRQSGEREEGPDDGASPQA